MKLTIAVILTCYNRKDKTISSLQALFDAEKYANSIIEVFLVDDGSTDGTSSAVQNEFPDVNIIKGTGTLFWNQGMRLAWQEAVKNKNYDFFLWLNDDTNVDSKAIVYLFECYNQYKLNNNQEEAIVVGACRNELGEEEFSYGLRNGTEKLTPNGELQKGTMLNGNLVLIPKNVYEKVGLLSNYYTHAMGDHDYGLRALEKGVELITTKKFIATCSINEGVSGWCDPKKSIKQRWEILHTPLGLNIKEYKIFIKRFWPKKYMVSILKVYLRCLMPYFYNKILKNGK